MPFINVEITKENKTPTKEQKEAFIQGVTELIAKILNKNKASTVVIVDEINTDNCELGSESITQVRKKQS